MLSLTTPQYCCSQGQHQSCPVPHQPSHRHWVELKSGHLCCNETERALLQAAQQQGTVSQEVARQTDGVLLAVGALSSVLKKKVSQQIQVLLLLRCVSKHLQGTSATALDQSP